MKSLTKYGKKGKRVKNKRYIYKVENNICGKRHNSNVPIFQEEKTMTKNYSDPKTSRNDVSDGQNKNTSNTSSKNKNASNTQSKNSVNSKNKNASNTQSKNAYDVRDNYQVENQIQVEHP